MVEHPSELAEDLVSVGCGRIPEGVHLDVLGREIAHFDFKQARASAFELPEACDEFWFADF